MCRWGGWELFWRSGMGHEQEGSHYVCLCVLFPRSVWWYQTRLSSSNLSKPSFSSLQCWDVIFTKYTISEKDQRNLFSFTWFHVRPNVSRDSISSLSVLLILKLPPDSLFDWSIVRGEKKLFFLEIFRHIIPTLRVNATKIEFLCSMFVFSLIFPQWNLQLCSKCCCKGWWWVITMLDAKALCCLRGFVFSL